MELRIDQIKIGERYRQDMGNLSLLSASIEQVGLLQPIGVTPDQTLVFGQRRLLAVQLLGWESIPARVIDVAALVLAEHAENEIREGFKPSERVAIGLAVEAALGKRQGQRTDLASAELSVNLPEVQKGKTTEIAADKAGFGSDKTYRDAKTVVQNAGADLVDAMDRGQIAISTAAKLADPKNAHVIATKWTGDPEGYTPAKYIAAAREALGGIDLDPASNDIAQSVVQATTYYTKDSNGLDKTWRGRVFLNPPYCQPDIKLFINKLVAHHVAGDVSQAILLTNNNTDTLWFHEAAVHASAICFTKGRIQFYKPDLSTTQPTNGQSFFYFGPDTDRFKAAFAPLGLIMGRL